MLLGSYIRTYRLLEIADKSTALTAIVVAGVGKFVSLIHTSTSASETTVVIGVGFFAIHLAVVPELNR